MGDVVEPACRQTGTLELFLEKENVYPTLEFTI
jgi:hypothetical protein